MDDVKSASATADGVLYAGRARLKHVVIKSSASGSPSISFRNKDASGAVLLIMDFVVAVNEDIVVPAEGILFENGIYVDITAIDRVTIFYA